MDVILARDGPSCVWCRRQLDDGMVPATTEHVVPRLKGGPSWIENEVAACERCNVGRGHRTPAEWMSECRDRGWDPDGGTLVTVLTQLDAAIERNGGQRRARAYVRSQLRRLGGSEASGKRIRGL